MSPNRVRIRLLSGAVLAALAPPLLAGRAGIVLAMAEDLGGSFHATWLASIYADAFGRLGYDFAVKPLPTRRASALSDAGLVDGEVNRVFDYGSAHADLIRIDPAHFSMTFSVYGRPSTRVGAGWTGLSEFGSPKIEYRSGVVRCQERLSATVPPSQLSEVNNATLGIRKLIAGRTDLYVDIESVVDRVLTRAEFLGAPIRKVAVLDTVAMHSYLHKSRRYLVQPLSAIIDAMRRDDTLEHYRRAAIDKFLDRK